MTEWKSVVGLTPIGKISGQFLVSISPVGVIRMNKVVLDKYEFRKVNLLVSMEERKIKIVAGDSLKVVNFSHPTCQPQISCAALLRMFGWNNHKVKGIPVTLEDDGFWFEVPKFDIEKS